MKDFKKDYYKILEISPTATVDGIKLAYRKQVKKYHPDLHPNNVEYEDLIREINEAYEVLGDKDERFAYDQYLSHKTEKQQEEAKTEKPFYNNRRTYTKTTKITKEERTYLKGVIFIKYCGQQDERADEDILREIFYKLKITQTDAIINEKHKLHPTQEFQNIFAKNSPIRLNIPQPISCQILDKNNIKRDYKLHLYDLTIPSVKIINVTKHESESFGTITGTFYAYAKEDKSYEDHIIVEECFGETGATERKTENGITYFRKEYYNTDCSKYWGNWIAEIRKNKAKPTGKTYQKGNYNWTEFSNGVGTKPHGRWTYNPRSVSQETGCFGAFRNILGIGFIVILFLFLLPNFAFLLPFLLIPSLLNIIPSKIWHWLIRIIGGLYLFLFAAAVTALIIDKKKTRHEEAVVKAKTVIEKPRYIPVVNPRSPDKIIDTLITHNLDWEDYNGKLYSGHFSVKKSSLNQAHCYKENLDISADGDNNYDKIIFSLKENDKNKLLGLYTMFDSIKLANKPSPKLFAEIIVSFVQSIPYTLVLPNACNAQYYQDDFTAKYLSSPDARCDGYQKFGINTPVEFIANLNGDCDTRTLLLYTVLSHYDYDVVLLSSAHYSHSILGINLPYDGAAFTYNTQRYIFWETTVQNIKPGILSDQISNTDYWRISLKSK